MRLQIKELKRWIIEMVTKEPIKVSIETGGEFCLRGKEEREQQKGILGL